MIAFVGAGPGAVDLITVRGQKLLMAADVIIYAGSLVNPQLLELAPAGCRIYDSAAMTLEEVCAVMQNAEAQGQRTVRLHTGDPSLYGAIREQMDWLDAVGIDYDVVPGVSSCFGAAASLKAEYTLPDVSQTVIITRMAGRTGVPEKEEISLLARHQATMVIFLSTGMLEELRERLLMGGYQGDTPAAIVYKATWPDEKVLRGTVDTLPQIAREHGITKTALILVGDFLGDTYARSRLYHPGFAHGYRNKECSGDD
jgi:precorrin-4 C11-methyltransferase